MQRLEIGKHTEDHHKPTQSGGGAAAWRLLTPLLLFAALFDANAQRFQVHPEHFRVGPNPVAIIASAPPKMTHSIFAFPRMSWWSSASRSGSHAGRHPRLIT